MKKHPVFSKLKKQGQPPVPVSLKMPKDLHERIWAIHKETGAPYSSVVFEFLRLGLKEVE
jgi:predicted DNA-binding protein